MKTKFRIQIGACLALLVAAQAAFAQFQMMPGQSPYGGYAAPTRTMPGQPQPYMGPMVPGMMPMMQQAMPVMQPPASAFRVSVAGMEQPPSIALVGHNADPKCDVTQCKDDGKGKSDCQCKGECHCACYHVRVFGDYMYLRARDAEQPFGVQINSQPPGSTEPAVQTSPIAIVDPDYSTGYRAGFGICLSDLSEFVMTYSAWETDTQNSITRNTPITEAIRSLVVHPAVPNAISDTVSASATLYMDFETIDADFRKIFYRDCTTDLTFLVGFRYGEFRQDFGSILTDDLAAPTPDAVVASQINFNGAGVRLGLEGEHYATRLPMLFYIKGITGLLAGEMRGTYQQTVQGSSNYGVDTAWRAGRIVPTFDLELGAGFYLPKGTFRLTAGYMFSAWTNMLKTEDWVDAVQANNYTDMGGVITLDGMVVRVEGRF